MSQKPSAASEVMNLADEDAILAGLCAEQEHTTYVVLAAVLVQDLVVQHGMNTRGTQRQTCNLCQQGRRKASSGAHPNPSRPQQIAQLGKAYGAGRSGLPRPRARRVWALYDTGAAPHACNHEKHFNKTKLAAAEGHDSSAVAAAGSPIGNTCQATVPRETNEGNTREAKFSDADVSRSSPQAASQMRTPKAHLAKPVVSHNGSRNHHAVEIGRIVSAMGVHWIVMIVDESLMTTAVPLGFVRRG